MKNVETEAISKKMKMTEEEIIKQLKEWIISNENVNKDIEESARKVKNSEEVAEVSKIWRKLLKVINVVYYGGPTNKEKYLQN